MATTAFKNGISASIGTSPVTIYTAPASTTSTVIGLSIANVTTVEVLVDVRLYDVSAGTNAYLVKQAPVPVGGSLIVIGYDQKVVLETTDYITITSNTATSVDAVLSVLTIV